MKPKTVGIFYNVLILLCALGFFISSSVRGQGGYDERVLDYEPFNEIELGESYEAILKRVGAADFDNMMYSKKGVLVGRRLLYIFKQDDPHIFNAKKDVYLRLWLDAKGYLQEIDFHNTPANISKSDSGA